MPADASHVTEWFEDEFLEGGCGSPTAQCACGRVHYADSRDFEEGEREELDRKAAAHPDRFLYDGLCDYISSYELDGVILVWGCPCNGLVRYERFIWSNRRRILKYLNARLSAIAAETAENLAAVKGAIDD